ncbi:MAG: tyrosine-type recombinase/integrase [Candidatus Tectomicrobia bacterium]|nr:tyrosine-type recombinase/integrase [Candidatus Tectomicrobia bacterium]
MSETALAVRSNLSHNVPAAIEAAKTRLTGLATLYLVTEVAGQSQATLDAKRRDLDRFLAFYHQLYGHDRPEDWFVSVTKAFLKHLRGQRFAQASLVRIYATVRHFARWLDRQFPGLFPLGCPTDGVKPPAEPAADWKGLTRLDELRLLNAVQTLRVRRGPGTDQGLRNHALFAALLGSGLRVSEVLNLDRDQYTGKDFTRVQVKGGLVRDVVPVHREARQVLDEWLTARQDHSPALFLTRTGRKLSRREAYGIIRRVAAQANAHLPEDDKIEVSPHVLRHTFLRKLAETKGVHYAREASGHQSDRYIWRYVKPDQQTLADAVDELD